MERVARLKVRKYQNSRTNSSTLHTSQATGRPSARSLRTRNLQTTLSSHSQSLLPNRCPRKVMDLPLLSTTQCLSTTLQRYFYYQFTCRTLAQVHYHRIYVESPRSDPTDLSICRGHLSGWRRLESLESWAGHQFKSFTANCSGWTDHFWYNGKHVIGWCSSPLQLAGERAICWQFFFLTHHQTQVHELGYAECPKSFVFRGTKDYSPKQIQDMLGLGGQAMNRAPNAPMPAPAQLGTARFLLPVQQVEFSLTGILEQLQRDPWPVANDKRPQRCTGVAVSVAVGLLEVC